MTPQERFDLIVKMRDDGKSAKEIGAAIGCERASAQNICSTLGIKKRFKKDIDSSRLGDSLTRESVRLEQTQSAGPDSAQANTPNAGSS